MNFNGPFWGFLCLGKGFVGKLDFWRVRWCFRRLKKLFLSPLNRKRQIFNALTPNSPLQSFKSTTKSIFKSTRHDSTKTASLISWRPQKNETTHNRLSQKAIVTTESFFKRYFYDAHFVPVIIYSRKGRKIISQRVFFLSRFIVNIFCWGIYGLGGFECCSVIFGYGFYLLFRILWFSLQ